MAYYFRFPCGLGKALTLSYDDGKEQDERMIAILDRFGIRCTFNLNSGCWAAEGTIYPEGTIHRWMTASQAARVYSDTQHEVAAHSLTHPKITELPDAEIQREISEDQANHEKMFCRPVRGFAYPYGRLNEVVINSLKENGILYGRKALSTRSFDIPQDWYRIGPTCHHGIEDLSELCDVFCDLQVMEESKLFYMWGHSFEFEEKNNWHILENFCQRMGGRNDIWYATNIQVDEYVNAFRSVQVSEDEKVMHNPTALDVWVEKDGQTYCLKAGSTMQF